MKTGFTCGAFDLLHAGHLLFLEECRKRCDFLVVGLQSDPSIDRPEKNKPIETIEERLIRLSACRFVGAVVHYETEADLYVLKANMHQLDVVFLGSDHEGKPFTGDDLPIAVEFIPRDHEMSSSSLKERIRRGS